MSTEMSTEMSSEIGVSKEPVGLCVMDLLDASGGSILAKKKQGRFAQALGEV